MSNSEAGIARSAPVRAPFVCATCGEPLYTRVRACPHCGAIDPAADPADLQPAPAGSPGAAAADAVEVAAPVTPVAGTVPDVDAPAAEFEGEVAAAADDDAVAPSAAFADDIAFTEIEPVEPVEPASPRLPRPPSGAAAARLDIAPDPYDPVADGRDLVLVPERGGRTVMLPEPRRRGWPLGLGLAILVLIGAGAAAMFGWRMLAGPPPMVAQELAVGTGWTAVELGADGGEWVVTADTPFRIRVDDAVYTVAGASGFAIPLGGRSVAVRAVSGETTITLARR